MCFEWQPEQLNRSTFLCLTKTCADKFRIIKWSFFESLTIYLQENTERRILQSKQFVTKKLSSILWCYCCIFRSSLAFPTFIITGYPGSLKIKALTALWNTKTSVLWPNYIMSDAGPWNHASDLSGKHVDLEIKFSECYVFQKRRNRFDSRTYSLFCTLRKHESTSAQLNGTRSIIRYLDRKSWICILAHSSDTADIQRFKDILFKTTYWRLQSS